MSSTRINRRYSWREVQDLARSLQAQARAEITGEEITEASPSRIVREERLRSEREDVNSSHPPPSKLNFDAERFRDAWATRQGEGVELVWRAHPLPSPMNTRDDEREANGWEQLRDYFLERHRVQTGALATQALSSQSALPHDQASDAIEVATGDEIPS